jgi:hypothetical protein
VDVATIVATSSTVYALVASFFGSMPNRRTAPFAIPLSAATIGRNTMAHPTSGNASTSTARSGIEKEMFFGIISPNTTCRNDTTSSVMTNAIVLTTSSGRCVRPSGAASRWWIAGSETLRMSSEAIVMPSCVEASMSVACSIAHSAVLANRDPASAFGSICERRAEMIANSAATKNPLTTSSTTRPTMPHQSAPVGPPLSTAARITTAPPWRRRLRGRG